jgi:tetratricopeptide (TPR) repeat protein
MGKKSKRNRDVSKKQMSASLLELVEKGDYEGILKLESDAILRATVLEEREPQQASLIYLVIANAFVETGLSSMIVREKAIHYLERSFALLEEKKMLHKCVRLLVPIYLQEGRDDEAVAAVKRMTASIPKHESIDPDLILSIANEFYLALLNKEVIDILTMFLGTINRSWDKEERASAYLAFGRGYTGLAEYEKADSFLHKALAITEDPERKVAVLCEMGSMSTYSCNYDDALAALNQALESLSAESGERREMFTDRWSKYTASVHAQIGDVLSEQGNHDLESLESFERALVIMIIIIKDDLGDVQKLAAMYQGIGLVHARLGNWDEAIKALKLGRSYIVGTDAHSTKPLCLSKYCEEIGRARLDQYFWDKRLLLDTQERENVLMEAATFSRESMEDGSYNNNALLLNYAQITYLIAGIEEANNLLMAYFEAEMEKKRGICCRSCRRKAGNGTDIKICRNCQVVDYCSEAHQTLAWRRGRLSHKVLCPFLKRYRLVVKAENRIDTESFEDICKDFFETVCVLKVR